MENELLWSLQEALVTVNVEIVGIVQIVEIVEIVQIVVIVVTVEIVLTVVTAVIVIEMIEDLLQAVHLAREDASVVDVMAIGLGIVRMKLEEIDALTADEMDIWPENVVIVQEQEEDITLTSAADLVPDRREEIEERNRDQNPRDLDHPENHQRARRVEDLPPQRHDVMTLHEAALLLPEEIRMAHLASLHLLKDHHLRLLLRDHPVPLRLAVLTL